MSHHRSRFSVRLLLLAGCALTATALWAQTSGDAPEQDSADAASLGYREALVLGLVEGITEYLPISSTGHLVLTNALLDLDQPTPMRDANGSIFKDAAGDPYTLKRAADAYVIIIQGGAILAVAVLYWSRLWSIARGLLGRDPIGRRLGFNILVAFLPAVFFGLLLNNWIEARLFAPIPIAIALAAGAVLMLLVERREHPREPDAGPDLPALSYRQCLVVGLLQCVAMWPGTSRSMMTIVGGYLVGLSPPRAAEFSFLLGFLTLSAAALYKTATDGVHLVAVLHSGPLLFGGLVAFIASALAVKWLVSYLTRHGLALFAWYRLVLAGLVLLFLA